MGRLYELRKVDGGFTEDQATVDGPPSNQIVTNFTGPVSLSAYLNGSGTPVPITPVVSGTFTAGVWNGTVRVTQPASGVVLRADDALGRFGLSAPFDVQAQTPLNFITQPTNQFVLPGTNVTLTALALGTGPVTYQWRFEGTNLPGATNASKHYMTCSHHY